MTDVKYNVKHKWNVAGQLSLLLANVSLEEAVTFAEQLAVTHSMQEWDLPQEHNHTRLWSSKAMTSGVAGHIWIEKIEMT